MTKSFKMKMMKKTMFKDLAKGFNIGFGILLSLGLFFGIVYAVGFHTANEISSGTFTGDYTFDGSISFKNSNLETCDNTSIAKIRYDNSSNDLKFCDGTSWLIIIDGTVPSLSLGDGSDGDLTVSTLNTIINNYTYLIADVSSGVTSFDVNNPSILSVGDNLLLHQTQGTNHGDYEFLTVSNIAGNTITVSSSLTNSYTTNSFNTTTAQVTQVVRVPQYTSVTIDGGASITGKAWDGYSGGIVVFKNTGTLTVTGDINVDGKGYRGGNGGTNTGGGGYQGESYTGLGIISTSINGGGGAGGQNCNEQVGGAGGSYGTAGTNGLIDANFPCGSQTPAGTTYGLTDLSKIYFGAGGGGGVQHAGYGLITNGGNGGGIVIIYTDTITTTGNILSKGIIGEDSLHDYSSNSGSGAGGSVYLNGNTINLGTNKVVATGAIAQTGTINNGDGGAGGNGRIRIDNSTTITGTSSPAVGYYGIFS